MQGQDENPGPFGVVTGNPTKDRSKALSDSEKNLQLMPKVLYKKKKAIPSVLS